MPSTVRLSHNGQCGSGHAMNKEAPDSGAFALAGTLYVEGPAWEDGRSGHPKRGVLACDILLHWGSDQVSSTSAVERGEAIENRQVGAGSGGHLSVLAVAAKVCRRGSSRCWWRARLPHMASKRWARRDVVEGIDDGLRMRQRRKTGTRRHDQREIDLADAAIRHLSSSDRSVALPVPQGRARERLVGSTRQLVGDATEGAAGTFSDQPLVLSP